MPFEYLKDDDGNVIAIVCSRGHRRRQCSTANCDNAATKLCDHKLKNGKTCDRPMCARCAKNVGPDRDLCPPHARLEERAPALQGIQ